ncbi:MAG: sensor histidine kinase [Leptospiraceae bacterium]|nr:sensor histidine kinase [Leptospiraceae bacterium]
MKRRNFYLILTVSFLLILLAIFGLAQNEFAGYSSHQQHYISDAAMPDIQYLVDEDRQIAGIQQIIDYQDHFSEKWINSSSDILNFGPSNDAVWIRFRFNHFLVSGEDQVLQISSPLLDEISFFHVVDGVVLDKHQSSYKIPINERYIPSPYFIFQLDPVKNKENWFYLRVTSKVVLYVPMKTYNISSFWRDYQYIRWIWGMYFGAMVVITLYNLFLFISVKDISYLSYVIYVISSILFFLTNENIGFELFWSSFPAIQNYFPNFISVYFFSMLLFTRSFLKTSSSVPKIDLLLKLMQAVTGIHFLLGIIIGMGSLMVKLSAPMTIGTVLSILIASVVQINNKFHSARIFLSAWVLVIISVIITGMQKNGVLPYNLYTGNALYVGTFMETLILAFALAYRINAERQSRLKAEMEKDQMEKLLESKERFAQIGEMASTIVHDIKNPMGVILAYTEMAEMENQDSKKRNEYLAYVSYEIEGLSNMAHEILDYCKGKIEINRSEHDIQEYFKDIFRYLKLETDISNVILETEISGEGTIAIDGSRMRRAIMNLSKNAIYAMVQDVSKENHYLIIHAEKTSDYLSILIRDNGPGIPENIKEKLFSPFTSKNTAKGTGLGLYQVKSTVDIHGGTITVDSGKDGTQFLIRLPLF